jgi:hypothetical protein
MLSMVSVGVCFACSAKQPVIFDGLLQLIKAILGL